MGESWRSWAWIVGESCDALVAVWRQRVRRVIQVLALLGQLAGCFQEPSSDERNVELTAVTCLALLILVLKIESKQGLIPAQHSESLLRSKALFPFSAS